VDSAIQSLRIVAMACAVVAFGIDAHAQNAVVGGGVGVAKANEAEQVGRGDRAGPDLGLAGRGFGWMMTDDGLGLGLTALHVVAPADDDTSTFTFVGFSGGAGSELRSTARFFVRVALGGGRSKGGCGVGAGGELGVRADARALPSLLLGASLSFTGALTGCSGIDDTQNAIDSEPPVLGSAVVGTIDVSFSP
jgi:hypothetical protein